MRLDTSLSRSLTKPATMPEFCLQISWRSYDLNGKLTKAPRFTPDSVDRFDTSKHSLFPVHIHVDRNGFVYVNLDAKGTPDVSWESQYGTLDQQEVLVSSGVDWNSVEFDLTWTKEGQFNWKLMQGNYNEVRTAWICRE
jgi:phenylpropionate dioxygenase-like ring-hydroxylating dioxygenase large terminal subunit